MLLTEKRIGEINMATAIKAIPTLQGKEAEVFLRHAEEAERNFKGFKNIEDHPYCIMARSILEKAGITSTCTVRPERAEAPSPGQRPGV